MNILVFAGCNDKKLLSKIKPILDSELVTKVFVVREYPMEFQHTKLHQYPAIKPLRKILVFREINRVINGLYIMLTQKINLLIGIHYLMHGIYSYILAKIFNKPFIILMIDDPFLYDRMITFRKIVREAKNVAVRGSVAKNYLIGIGVDETKIFNPPNEFYMPEDIVIKGFRDKKYDLAYWGNFVEIKDLPLWIEIFEQTKKVKGNLKGLLLGDGVLFENIKKIIADKGLTNDIDLPGRVKDVNPYINDTRLLLMTSRSEGLPMDVVESMALAVPAIVPNVGDVKDLIKDKVSGFIVNSRNPRDYKEKILTLLNDERIYKNFSDEALSTMKEYSIQTTSKALINLWDDILKGI